MPLDFSFNRRKADRRLNRLSSSPAAETHHTTQCSVSDVRTASGTNGTQRKGPKATFERLFGKRSGPRFDIFRFNKILAAAEDITPTVTLCTDPAPETILSNRHVFTQSNPELTAVRLDTLIADRFRAAGSLCTATFDGLPLYHTLLQKPEYVRNLFGLFDITTKISEMRREECCKPEFSLDLIPKYPATFGYNDEGCKHASVLANGTNRAPNGYRITVRAEDVLSLKIIQTATYVGIALSSEGTPADARQTFPIILTTMPQRIRFGPLSTFSSDTDLKDGQAPNHIRKLESANSGTMIFYATDVAGLEKKILLAELCHQALKSSFLRSDTPKKFSFTNVLELLIAGCTNVQQASSQTTIESVSVKTTASGDMTPQRDFDGSNPKLLDRVNLLLHSYLKRRDFKTTWADMSARRKNSTLQLAEYLAASAVDAANIAQQNNQLFEVLPSYLTTVEEILSIPEQAFAHFKRDFSFDGVERELCQNHCRRGFTNPPCAFSRCMCWTALCGGLFWKTTLFRCSSCEGGYNRLPTPGCIARVRAISIGSSSDVSTIEKVLSRVDSWDSHVLELDEAHYDLSTSVMSRLLKYAARTMTPNEICAILYPFGRLEGDPAFPEAAVILIKILDWVLPITGKCTFAQGLALEDIHFDRQVASKYSPTLLQWDTSMTTPKNNGFNREGALKNSGSVEEGFCRGTCYLRSEPVVPFPSRNDSDPITVTFSGATSWDSACDLDIGQNRHTLTYTLHSGGTSPPCLLEAAHRIPSGATAILECPEIHRHTLFRRCFPSSTESSNRRFIVFTVVSSEKALAPASGGAHVSKLGPKSNQMYKNTDEVHIELKSISALLHEAPAIAATVCPQVIRPWILIRKYRALLCSEIELQNSAALSETRTLAYHRAEEEQTVWMRAMLNGIEGLKTIPIPFPPETLFDLGLAVTSSTRESDALFEDAARPPQTKFSERIARLLLSMFEVVKLRQQFGVRLVHLVDTPTDQIREMLALCSVLNARDTYTAASQFCAVLSSQINDNHFSLNEKTLAKGRSFPEAAIAQDPGLHGSLHSVPDETRFRLWVFKERLLSDGERELETISTDFCDNLVADFQKFLYRALLGKSNTICPPSALQIVDDRVQSELLRAVCTAAYSKEDITTFSVALTSISAFLVWTLPKIEFILHHFRNLSEQPMFSIENIVVSVWRLKRHGAVAPAAYCFLLLQTDATENLTTAPRIPSILSLVNPPVDHCTQMKHHFEPTSDLDPPWKISMNVPATGTYHDGAKAWIQLLKLLGKSVTNESVVFWKEVVSNRENSAFTNILETAFVQLFACDMNTAKHLVSERLRKIFSGDFRSEIEEGSPDCDNAFTTNECGSEMRNLNQLFLRLKHQLPIYLQKQRTIYTESLQLIQRQDQMFGNDSIHGAYALRKSDRHQTDDCNTNINVFSKVSSTSTLPLVCQQMLSKFLPSSLHNDTLLAVLQQIPQQSWVATVPLSCELQLFSVLKAVAIVLFKFDPWVGYSHSEVEHQQLGKELTAFSDLIWWAGDALNAARSLVTTYCAAITQMQEPRYSEEQLNVAATRHFSYFALLMGWFHTLEGFWNLLCGGDADACEASCSRALNSFLSDCCRVARKDKCAGSSVPDSAEDVILFSEAQLPLFLSIQIGCVLRRDAAHTNQLMALLRILIAHNPATPFFVGLPYNVPPDLNLSAEVKHLPLNLLLKTHEMGALESKEPLTPGSPRASTTPNQTQNTKSGFFSQNRFRIPAEVQALFAPVSKSAPQPAAPNDRSTKTRWEDCLLASTIPEKKMYNLLLKDMAAVKSATPKPDCMFPEQWAQITALFWNYAKLREEILDFSMSRFDQIEKLLYSEKSFEIFEKQYGQNSILIKDFCSTLKILSEKERDDKCSSPHDERDRWLTFFALGANHFSCSLGVGVPRYLRHDLALYAIAPELCAENSKTVHAGNEVWWAPRPQQLMLTTPSSDRNLTDLSSLGNNVAPVSLACGQHHTLALTAAGELYGWGANECMQVGVLNTCDFDKRERLSIKQDTESQPFSCLPTRNECYYDRDDLVECAVEFPTRIHINGSRFGHICCGLDFSMALSLEGQLYAWGSAEEGCLGYLVEQQLKYSGPRPVYSEQLVHQHLYCVFKLRYALTRGNMRITNGMMSNQISLITRDVLSMVNTQARKFEKLRSICCGSMHCLAIDKEANLWAWGRGEAGQLGVHPNFIRWLSPIELRFGTEAKDVVDDLSSRQRGKKLNIQFPILLHIYCCPIRDSAMDANVKIAVVDLLSALFGANHRLDFCLPFVGIEINRRCGFVTVCVPDILMQAFGIRGPANYFRSPSAASAASLSFAKVEFQHIAAGEAHSVAVGHLPSFDQYLMFSWGQGAYGQLGCGDLSYGQSSLTIPGHLAPLECGADFYEEFTRLQSVGNVSCVKPPSQCFPTYESVYLKDKTEKSNAASSSTDRLLSAMTSVPSSDTNVRLTAAAALQLSYPKSIIEKLKLGAAGCSNCLLFPNGSVLVWGSNVFGVLGFPESRDGSGNTSVGFHLVAISCEISESSCRYPEILDPIESAALKTSTEIVFATGAARLYAIQRGGRHAAQLERTEREMSPTPPDAASLASSCTVVCFGQDLFGAGGRFANDSQLPCSFFEEQFSLGGQGTSVAKVISLPVESNVVAVSGGAYHTIIAANSSAPFPSLPKLPFTVAPAKLLKINSFNFDSAPMAATFKSPMLKYSSPALSVVAREREVSSDTLMKVASHANSVGSLEKLLVRFDGFNNDIAVSLSETLDNSGSIKGRKPSLNPRLYGKNDSTGYRSKNEYASRPLQPKRLSNKTIMSPMSHMISPRRRSKTDRMQSARSKNGGSTTDRAAELTFGFANSKTAVTANHVAQRRELAKFSPVPTKSSTEFSAVALQKHTPTR